MRLKLMAFVSGVFSRLGSPPLRLATWSKSGFHQYDFRVTSHSRQRKTPDPFILAEAKLGTTLEWERLDTKRACRIAVYRDGDIDADTQTFEEIREWMIKYLLKFKEVFPSLIQQALA